MEIDLEGSSVAEKEMENILRESNITLSLFPKKESSTNTRFIQCANRFESS